MQLINGDSVEILKTIPSESIDLIVTDPPYRTISGGVCDDNEFFHHRQPKGILSKNDGKIFEHNDVDIEDWIGECYRILKPDTHIYIMTNMLNLVHYLNAVQDSGFVIHNLLVWKKNTANPNRWYMKNCEYTIFARKGKAKTINDPGSMTVMEFDNIRNKEHPTQKPVELMELYVSNSSNGGDTVLDPFMGSGSVGKACKKLGRNFIGIEIDEKYFSTTKQSLESTLVQPIIPQPMFAKADIATTLLGDMSI